MKWYGKYTELKIHKAVLAVRFIFVVVVVVYLLIRVILNRSTIFFMKLFMKCFLSQTWYCLLSFLIHGWIKFKENLKRGNFCHEETFKLHPGIFTYLRPDDLDRGKFWPRMVYTRNDLGPERNESLSNDKWIQATYIFIQLIQGPFLTSNTFWPYLVPLKR